MNLFYTPTIESGIALMEEEEAIHCTKVFRHKPGDVIYITNGSGGLFKAQIITCEKKKCTLQILETIEKTDKTIPLHIAIAPTKNIARTEWFLEKATEAGIAAITPILCEHSERQNINIERLLRVMIAAMKQSLQCRLPILSAAQDFKKFIASCNDELKIIAVCDKNAIPLAQIISKNKTTTLIIGPEGDFSKTELQLASSHQFIPTSFGNNRFRTESAALYAAFIFHHFNQ